MSDPFTYKPSRATLRRHRLVLLVLAAPFVGIGIVFWLLLPGGVAAPAYSTLAFRHNAVLRPDYWPTKTVTIRGYLSPVRCTTSTCERMVLTGVPEGARVLEPDALPADAVLIAAQPESGWHRALRRLLPSAMAPPLISASHPGRWTSLTGALRAGYSGTGPPIFVPIAL
ncbi:MAG: hypothetical protein ACRDG4_18150 [Chloroflexota bacterium]